MQIKRWNASSLGVTNLYIRIILARFSKFTFYILRCTVHSDTGTTVSLTFRFTIISTLGCPFGEETSLANATSFLWLYIFEFVYIDIVYNTCIYALDSELRFRLYCCSVLTSTSTEMDEQVPVRQRLIHWIRMTARRNTSSLGLAKR